MNGIIKALGGVVARHVLTGIATYLVSQGIITDDQSTQVVGAVVLLGSVGWAGIQKFRQKSEVATALATPTQVPALDQPDFHDKLGD